MRSDNLRRHMKQHSFLQGGKIVTELAEVKTNGIQGYIKHNPLGDENTGTEVTPEDEEDLFQNFIQMDIEELLHLFDEFPDDDEYRSEIENLENLCNEFYSQYDGNEQILQKIDVKLDQLKQSSIPRTELIRVKILINKIEEKRYIFREMYNGMKYTDINRRWKTLAQQGFITSEMYHDLNQLNKPNLKDIISVLI